MFSARFTIDRAYLLPIAAANAGIFHISVEIHFLQYTAVARS